MAEPVVVVQPDEDRRIALCDSLEAAGYEAIPFSSASEAIDSLASVSEARLVFVDLSGDEEDGRRLLLELRQRFADAPVVAMIASSEDRSRASAVDRVMAPPFEVAELVKVARAFLTEQRTVLVVDDEPSVCRLVRHVLGKRGYDVITVEDGEAAIALLRSKPVEILIVDQNLPGITGGDVVKLAREILPKVSTVMISSDPQSRLAASASGVEVFLEKPFHHVEILEKAISGALLLREQRMHRDAGGRF